MDEVAEAILTAEVERLRGLLADARDAFDEVTGDYQKELVSDEGWYVEIRPADTDEDGGA